MWFIKSYQTDYEEFKRRYKNAGLGSAIDAANAWRYLLGSNKYMKKQTLQRLKDNGVILRDLNTLDEIVKSSII